MAGRRMYFYSVVARLCFKVRCVVVASLICWSAFADADAPRFLPQDLTVRVWNKEQGLPDNSVTAVLQTQDGYLWVGTSAGLARFDGVRFVPVLAPAAKSNVLIRVAALCEDTWGRLWIGSLENGLLCYENGTVSRFYKDELPPNETINSIANDAAGNLWLGTASGLCRLTEGKLMRFTAKDGLPNDFVSGVNVARSGTVWITTRGGMCQFKNGKIDPYPFQTDSPGRSPESLGVYEDRAGNLWAFGDTYLVNLTEGKHLNHFGSGENIASLRIWSLCEGRHGELWIGTSGKGLYCFTDDQFIPITLRNGGLASDVRSLCEDREGNLWLGTYGGGLVRLQPRNVRVLDSNVGLPNRAPVCFALNPQGRVWVGFEHEGLYLGDVERFERFSGEGAANLQDLISSICLAPSGVLWVGTPGDGIYCADNQRTVHYGTADGLSDNSIWSIAPDGSGGVWAGTFSGALNHLVRGRIVSFGTGSGLREQPVTTILATPRGDLWIGFADGAVSHGDGEKFLPVMEPAALGGKAIRAMNEDAAGRLWTGNSAGRLACVAGGAFYKWDLSLGSANDSLLGLLTDDKGDLWLSTGRSIYRIAQRDINAALAGEESLRPKLVFEAEAGETSVSSFGWPRALKAADGKLWFCMASGLVVLDPRRLVVDSSPPPVLIEEVTVNDSVLVRAKSRSEAASSTRADPPERLPSDLRSLQIQFTALNLSAPEGIRFRHRLEGFESDWVNGGGERFAHYGRLPYGNYTFRVQAGNADGWYANQASFSFTIPTPAWRAEWALTFYGVIAAALITGVARVTFTRRLRRRLAVLAAQQAMERERMRIAQDMHDEIGSKLTKISFMSERAKGELRGQEPVASKLDSIAHTSRDLLQSLDEIVWAVNPHNDTLEHLAAYLGHYATEYLQNTAVECELHIPQSLPHHPLSAETRHNLFLAFEEALNNALKHSQATQIRVDMHCGPAQFEIKIEDNGCGFDMKSVALNSEAQAPGGRRVGNGLKNLQQRLADVGGQCSIRSHPGRGTTVNLTVPLKPAAKSG